MKLKQPLWLCMGSACHQLGGYRLIPQLEALIREQKLDGLVELRGAFCLDHCEHGRSARLGEQVLTGLTPENLAQRFAAEIMPHLHLDRD